MQTIQTEKMARIIVLSIDNLYSEVFDEGYFPVSQKAQIADFKAKYKDTNKFLTIALM